MLFDVILLMMRVKESERVGGQGVRVGGERKTDRQRQRNRQTDGQSGSWKEVGKRKKMREREKNMEGGRER